MSNPGQVEVVAWMTRTGGGAADAADHFFPGVSPEQRAKLAAKFRVWKQRAGLNHPAPQASANVPGDDEDAPPPARITVEDRHHEVARLDRIPFLELQLARAEAVLEQVMATGNVGRYAQIDARISDIRQDLDMARGQGKPVTLDRDPAAVAEEVEKRQKRIAELAAAARVAREREL